jgi:tripartite-type tricarboxylate transporter receptor subunit TctC
MSPHLRATCFVAGGRFVGRLLLVLAFGAATPASAFAQAWPTKPIKIIVPAQPGGGLDLVGRTVAEQLGRAFDQSVVVENVSGGGGQIASQSTARAAPDGYTLMVGYVGTHGVNPAVRKVPYDAVRDFTAIAMVGGTPNVLVVTPSLPAADMKSLVAYAKKNAGKMNYASAGIGSLGHLLMEQFRADAGFDAVAAHYRGIGPGIVDVLAGQAMMMMPGLAAALPHIRAQKMRPIAITGLKRHPLVPEVPTFEESGYKGYDGVQWYGIVGPARLPAEVTRRLNAEINKAIATPQLQQRLSGEALEPLPMSPEQFGQFIQSDIARWSRLARERKISLDD